MPGAKVGTLCRKILLMNKLKMHSPDLTQANIDKLAELFPNCLVESRDANGVVTRSIDFDELRQELSGSIAEGPQERYQLNWPGKREALLTANAPIAKTLRPSREESVDFDTTQNLFIEGDNLDALKLLQETYLNKVKLIYIDPPYNTGNDFIYEDDFAEDSSGYLERSNQKDIAGNRMVANTEANGRFHSDWLSMMYARLKLARNLLRDDGVIFISIDDNEQANLKRMCDEIFGEENFVANVLWQKKYSAANDHKTIAPLHDHILVFRKSGEWERNLMVRTESMDKQYRLQDEHGIFRADNYLCNKSADERPNLYYPIIQPNTGEEIWPKRSAVWRYSQETHLANVKNDLVYWGKDGVGKVPAFKRYKHLLKNGGLAIPTTWWTFEECGHNDEAQKETSELLSPKIFSTPKPTRLLQKILRLGSNDDDLVMDFFAGSGAFGDAVMRLNAEEGGTRHFILVQIPEPCDEKSEAAKAGYSTISEITKERVRRAGAKIKSSGSDDLELDTLDIGFRVLKIDSSNMKEVFYSPDAVSQEKLFDQVNNIREDRTPEDLLFQVLLDWGVYLALPIVKETIEGKSVYFVDGNALAACFEEGVSEDFVKLLAKREPLRVVFRDAGFASDSVKINVEQIFKLMSPGTEVKTI